MKIVSISIKNISLLVLFAGLLLVSCRDKESPPPSPSINKYDTISNFQGLLVPTNGKLKVKVSYVFGNNPVELNTQFYNTIGGDTFTISLIRHYFSNLTLIGEEKSINLGNYQLINAAEEPGKSFEISGVQAGVYNQLSLVIGVDSVRNSSGLQEGALDPAYGMFWTWATGYIFFKLEGRTTQNQTFGLHVGSNTIIPINTASLSQFKIKSTSPTLTIAIDLKEMLEGPYNYSLPKDGHNIHSPSDPSNNLILNNMKDMIKVISIEG